jgi:chromosome segregation ATPase
MLGQDVVSRNEMEQLDKRFTAHLDHLSKGMSSIQDAIGILTSTMVDLKVTQERVVTSMEQQEKILAKVTDTEERCTDIEREVYRLKSKVTTMEQERKDQLLQEKDNKKWTKRIVVTTVLGLISSAVGLLLSGG